MEILRQTRRRKAKAGDGSPAVSGRSSNVYIPGPRRPLSGLASKVGGEGDAIGRVNDQDAETRYHMFR